MKNSLLFTLAAALLFLLPQDVKPQLTLKWNKYDFVPGEKIIFEDNHEGEENGEFPSRWDLAGGGNVENAVFGDRMSSTSGRLSHV